MHTIKSFVLRAGRLSRRQTEGLENLLPHYRLAADTGVWDLESVFERKADTVVEVGFGMGAALLSMAKAKPELNFIGIEVHQPGLGALAADLYEQRIKNVRIAAFDAVLALRDCIADASLAGLNLFFPDPWPKKRHHKRRIVQPEFVKLVASKLAIGGVFHCATDWQEYADQMLQVLSAEPSLQNWMEDGGFIQRPADRPETKFELRGKRLGHEVWDLVFERRNRV